VTSGVLPGLLRLASRIICLIVIASFVLFVVNQTSNASKGQQRELSTGSTQETPGSTASASSHESTARKTIDEVAGELTSPFSAVTSGSTNQWVIRGTNLVLALLVYGFGLGFVARMLSVRT
jgi:hypothetical protein